MPQPIQIIIADDHILVREGLSTLLNEEPDISVVAQASTGTEAIYLVRQLCPDIAILDITMPDMTGLEATRQITTEFPETIVIILTMHEEEAFFFEALRAGASGYLLKGARSEEFLNAIRVAHKGGIYLQPALTRVLVEDYLERQPQTPLENPLTPREFEVLELIAGGLTNPMIAEQLSVSVHTVKSHRARIYEKLNVNDRAKLIAYAQRHGLL